MGIPANDLSKSCLDEEDSVNNFHAIKPKGKRGVYCIKMGKIGIRECSSSPF